MKNIYPKITVLMPVYNCELYIREAVNSILNQSFTDFEFLIIDDASSDETVSIIKSYSDYRIQLIEKSINSGYTNSLNHGFKLAKGEFIARMDADDISLPERFAKQIAFFEKNPDTILCGSCFIRIGSAKVIIVPEYHENIKVALLKGNCIAHPTVMIRKQILDTLPILYDVLKEPAEDYDLWVRLLSVGKLHNLQEILLNYRVHETQVSHKRRQQQIESALESRLQILTNLNYSFSNYEIVLLKNIIGGSTHTSIGEIEEFIILKEKLIKANSNNFFEPNEFLKYLNDLQEQSFKNYFVHRTRYHPLISLQYFASRNKLYIKLQLIDEMKLILKSIILFKKKL